MQRFTFVLLVLCSVATVAQSQTVVLPTIRSSKSVEATLLNHAINDILGDSSNLAAVKKGDPAITLDTLKCDLAQIALAPYTEQEVLSAKSDSATEKRGRSVTLMTLLRSSHRRQGVKESDQEVAVIMNRVPKGCELNAPPAESFVRITMSKYVDAESDVGRKARLDTLARVALANVIIVKLRTSHWFPVRSHDQAMLFWKQPSSSSLNVGAVTGSGDQGTTFTELTSRFLHPLRISINTVIAAAKDSTKPAQGATSAAASTDTSKSTTAISRFLNGGGLLNLAAAVPWVHYGSVNGAGDIIGLFAPRFGGTLPVLGAGARDTTLMYDVGAEVFAKSADYRDGIGVFFQTRIGYAGGTSRFMSAIGDPLKSHTAYETISLGLTLDDKYLITLSRTVAGPHALQTGWQIGTTLARSGSQPSAGGP